METTASCTFATTAVLLRILFFIYAEPLRCFFFFQAEDGIRDRDVTGVQTCALPISEKQGIHKVILDVRECGRGPVSEAISTARLFVPSGTVTTLRGQTVSTQVFSAEPKQVIWKNPVSVLVDATTSGAAEVL